MGIVLHWEVSKYGQEVDRTDIRVEGRVDVTTIIYMYKGKLYQELWNSGTCVHYGEIAE